MSEWQPAIWVDAHPEELPAKQKEGTRIWVQERKAEDYLISRYRSLGCDATRFFAVSEDGENQLVGYDNVGYGVPTVCEHEIITD